MNLGKMFEADEVKAAIWECDGNWSPRPAGSIFVLLIKRSWDIMRNDIVRIYDAGIPYFWKTT